MTLELSLSCGEYAVTLPLLDGTVEPNGIELQSVPLSSAERHLRMIRHREFDICELSLGSYLLSRTEPEVNPFTAIPVMPHRRFRHSYMFVPAESDIVDPGDLEGKRVGLRTLQNTAGVWMRGIAHEHYGLDLTSVTWHIDDPPVVPFDPPDRFDVVRQPLEVSMEDQLVAGDLDGVFHPVLFGAVTDPDGGARRLFEDAMAEERRYFTETGIFPPMHVVVVRDDILDTHPWVARNVAEAFVAARDQALRDFEDPRTPLAWGRRYLEEERSLFGENPFPYGLGKENRRALMKFIDYALLVGLLHEQYDLDSLFVSNTLDEAIR